jgi:hypothetical protein
MYKHVSIRCGCGFLEEDVPECRQVHWVSVKDSEDGTYLVRYTAPEAGETIFTFTLRCLPLAQPAPMSSLKEDVEGLAKLAAEMLAGLTQVFMTPASRRPVPFWGFPL